MVNARIRPESSQDVPASISVLSGEQLQAFGVETIGNLTAHVPGLHYLETGISSQLRIRGVGSDNSQGFEQSVGMYVDGISYGRSLLFRTPLFDLQRVELLRGPQSTLFGKNSIAGAVNITSARPTEEFFAKTSISYEPRFGSGEINGVLSGPVNANTKMRLAVRGYESDGYFDNTLLNQSEAQKDEQALRFSIDWDTTEKLGIFFKAENNQFETVGRTVEVNYDQSLVAGPNYSDYLQLFNYPPVDTQLNFERQTDTPDNSDSDVQSYNLSAVYQLGDYSIKSINGFITYDYRERCDCDYVSAEIIDLKTYEEYRQRSHELRIESPANNMINWLAGLYYQHYQMDFFDQVDVSGANFLVQTTLPMIANTGLRRDFYQQSDSWSVFGNLNFAVAEKVEATVSARYARENKKATKVINVVEAGTANVLNDPVAGYVYLNAFATENEQARVVPIPNVNPANWPALAYSGHNVKGNRDENAFIPSVSIEYRPIEDTLYYATWSKGFKAGGFDPRSNRVGNFSTLNPPASSVEPNPLLNFEFAEEEVTAYEIGFKNSYWQRRLELNVALFRTLYDDLQTSQFDGGVGFNVGNVSAVVLKGLEIEGRVQFSDNFSGRYSLAWLDSEYRDFATGNCYVGQQPDGVDLDNDGFLDTCDNTGKRPFYSPKYTVNFGLDYEKMLADGLRLFGLLDLQRVASQQVHVNLDPQGEIPSYTMLDLKIGLRIDNFQFSILANNVLDEKIISYSGNAPLSASQFATNTHVSWIQSPRTLSAEVMYQF